MRSLNYSLAILTATTGTLATTTDSFTGTATLTQYTKSTTPSSISLASLSISSFPTVTPSFSHLSSKESSVLSSSEQATTFYSNSTTSSYASENDAVSSTSSTYGIDESSILPISESSYFTGFIISVTASSASDALSVSSSEQILETSTFSSFADSSSVASSSSIRTSEATLTSEAASSTSLDSTSSSVLKTSTSSTSELIAAISTAASASTTSTSVVASTSSYSTSTINTVSTINSKAPTTTKTSTTSKSSTTSVTSTTSKTSTSSKTSTTSKTSTSEPSTSKTSSSTTTTSKTSQTTPTDTSLTDFNDIMLSYSNQKRALHGVPSLIWNNTLAEYAQAYIESLEDTSYPACSGTLVHSSRTGLDYGENLAWGTISDIQAIDLWYNEIEYYDFEDPADSSGTFEQYGHFTQLVWKASAELGCAYKSCDGNIIYVICEYSPAGNIFLSGDDEYYYFKQNVLAPVS